MAQREAQLKDGEAAIVMAKRLWARCREANRFGD
jgi:hypothetical protein